MTTATKIHRVSKSDLERFVRNNETPAGVSLWVGDVSLALSRDDWRAEDYDAVLASAPLTPADVDWLIAFCDEDEPGEHPAVDLSSVADEDEELAVALEQILRARAEEMLASQWAPYII